MKSPARCPSGSIAKVACVTEKCNASAFMCQTMGCDCMRAHKYCKTMNWKSLLQLIENYEQEIPDPLKNYMKRIEKIYCSIVSKVKNEAKIFIQYVQDQIFGPEFANLKHYLEKQKYDKITCNNLGGIVSKLTERINWKKSNQEGSSSLQKFTLNEMRQLDHEITSLLHRVEDLYKNKYQAIINQITQVHQKQSIQTKNGGLSKKSQYKSEQLADRRTSTTLTSFGSQNQNISLKSSTQRQLSFSGTKIKASSVQGKSTADDFQSQTKEDLTYPKYINSKIIKQATVLNNFLQSKVKQYRLIYRGSQNDFSIKKFYQKVSNHTFFNSSIKTITSLQNRENSLTLLLAQTQFGRVLGGFTRLKWHQNQAQVEDQLEDISEEKDKFYKQDIRGSTMMFSVDLNQKYKLLDPKKAIYCGRKSIGFGKNDLKIVNHSDKSSKNCVGFPNSFNNGLYLPIKKSSLTLSGSHDRLHFKMTQWQLFQVILKEESNIIIQKQLSKKLTF